MFKCLKIMLGKDRYNPSTLFNPFKHRHCSMWQVFLKNLGYELFWRNWYRDDHEEIRKIYLYSVSLEKRIEKMEKEVSAQQKWTRLEYK